MVDTWNGFIGSGGQALVGEGVVGVHIVKSFVREWLRLDSTPCEVLVMSWFLVWDYHKGWRVVFIHACLVLLRPRLIGGVPLSVRLSTGWDKVYIYAETDLSEEEAHAHLLCCFKRPGWCSLLVSRWSVEYSSFCLYLVMPPVSLVNVVFCVFWPCF